MYGEQIMARRCPISGKGVQAGNNVSHAKNRTRRRFLPNLQIASLYSDALRETVRLRVTTHALRSIEHKGGFDSWLASASPTKLTKVLRRLKKRLAAATP